MKNSKMKNLKIIISIALCLLMTVTTLLPVSGMGFSYANQDSQSEQAEPAREAEENADRTEAVETEAEATDTPSEEEAAAAAEQAAAAEAEAAAAAEEEAARQAEEEAARQAEEESVDIIPVSEEAEEAARAGEFLINIVTYDHGGILPAAPDNIYPIDGDYYLRVKVQKLDGYTEDGEEVWADAGWTAVKVGKIRKEQTSLCVSEYVPMDKDLDSEERISFDPQFNRIDPAQDPDAIALLQPTDEQWSMSFSNAMNPDYVDTTIPERYTMAEGEAFDGGYQLSLKRDNDIDYNVRLAFDGAGTVEDVPAFGDDLYALVSVNLQTATEGVAEAMYGVAKITDDMKRVVDGQVVADVPIEVWRDGTGANLGKKYTGNERSITVRLARAPSDTDIASFITGQHDLAVGDAIGEYTLVSYPTEQKYPQRITRTNLEERHTTSVYDVVTLTSDQSRIDKALEANGVLNYKGDGYQVSLAFDAESGITSDTQLAAEELAEDSDDYQNYSKAASEALGVSPDQVRSAKAGKKDGKSLVLVGLYDITLSDESGEIEPAAPVDVNITYEKAAAAGIGDRSVPSLKVLHLEKSKESDDVKVTVLGSGVDETNSGSVAVDARTGETSPLSMSGKGETPVEFTIDSKRLTDVSFTADSFSGYGVAYMESEGATFDDVERVPVAIRKNWETTGTQEQLNEQKQAVNFTVYGGSGTEKMVLPIYAEAEGTVLAEARLTSANSTDPGDADCNTWEKTVYVPKGYVKDGEITYFTDGNETGESETLNLSVEEDTDDLTAIGGDGAWEKPRTSYEPAHVEEGVYRPESERSVGKSEYLSFDYTHYVTFKSDKKVKNVTIKVINNQGDRYQWTVESLNTLTLNSRDTQAVAFNCPFAFDEIKLDGNLILGYEGRYGGWYEETYKGTLYRTKPAGAVTFSISNSGSGHIYYAAYTTPSKEIPDTLTITNNYRPIERVEVYVQKKWEINHGSQAELDAQKQPVYFTVTGHDGDDIYELPAYENKTGDEQVTCLTEEDETNDPNLWERSVWVPDGVVRGDQGVSFAERDSFNFSITEDTSNLKIVGNEGYWGEASAQATTRTIAGSEPPNEFGHYRLAFRGNETSPMTQPRSAKTIYVEFKYTDENGNPNKKAKLLIDLGRKVDLPTGNAVVFNLRDIRIPTTWGGYKTTGNGTGYFSIDYIELDGENLTDKFTDDEYGNEYTQLRLYRNNPTFGSGNVIDIPLTTDMYLLLYKDIHGKEVAVGHKAAEDTVSPCLKLTNTFMTQPLCKIVDTNGKEHAFYALTEAVTWSREHRDAAYTAGTCAIEMLTDYTMDAGDRVELTDDDNIRLTTAAGSGSSAKFKFKGSGDKALISRGSGFDSKSMFEIGDGAQLALTNIVLDGAEAASCSADGSLVKAGSGGALKVGNGAILRNGRTTGNGAGIYLAEGSSLGLSGNPQFSGNNLYDAELAGKKRGNTELTATVPQDIYLANASEEAAPEITVEGDLDCEQHAIAVWAADPKHYQRGKQFAMIGQGVSADPAVFWNPRPDSDTDNCTGEDLTGILGESEGCIYWNGSTATLTVENSIDMTSAYAVQSDKFQVSVTLCKAGDESKPISEGEIPDAAEGVTLERTEANGSVTALKYTKSLGDGDNFSVDVPIGWSYTVEENATDNYVVKYKVVGTDSEYTESENGVTQIMAEDTTVYLKNSRDTVPPMTGLTDHGHRGLILTFLLLLALGILWVAVRCYRKKRLAS